MLLRILVKYSDKQGEIIIPIGKHFSRRKGLSQKQKMYKFVNQWEDIKGL